MESRKGFVFLILGGSGSGKTSLSNEIHRRIDSIKKLPFYTTRKIRQTEFHNVDYHFVSNDQYTELEKNGRFKYTYLCHGNEYGIPIELDDIINGGDSVIIGVSRKLIPQIQTDYPNTRTIYVDVTSEDSLSRMLARGGGESCETLVQRLEKTEEIRRWALKNKVELQLVLDNSMSFDERVDCLERFIRGELHNDT